MAIMTTSLAATQYTLKTLSSKTGLPKHRIAMALGLDQVEDEVEVNRFDLLAVSLHLKNYGETEKAIELYELAFEVLFLLEKRLPQKDRATFLHLLSAINCQLKGRRIKGLRGTHKLPT